MDHRDKSGQKHPTVCGEKKVVCLGPDRVGIGDHSKMFKRPTVRPANPFRGATKVSPVSETAPGIVGDLTRTMRNNYNPTPKPPTNWRPSHDYPFIAKHMPEAEAVPFVARCEAWFAENAKPANTKPPPPVLDPAPMLALLAKYKDRRPPCDAMCAAMLAAGHTEQRIAKYRQWIQNMEDTAEERQQVLDKIFAKYPSANKPAPKKKVVIKAVKKKMN